MARADALGGELRLVLAQRDAGRVDLELLGEIRDQGPPAAADVEQPIPGLELQLLADVADLPLLRGLAKEGLDLAIVRSTVPAVGALLAQLVVALDATKTAVDALNRDVNIAADRRAFMQAFADYRNVQAAYASCLQASCPVP